MVKEEKAELGIIIMLLSLVAFLVFFFFKGIENQNELINLTFLLSFLFIILIILPSFVLIKNKKDLYEGFAMIAVGIMLVSFFSVSFFFLASSFVKVFDEEVCVIKEYNSQKNLSDCLDLNLYSARNLNQIFYEVDSDANK